MCVCTEKIGETFVILAKKICSLCHKHLSTIVKNTLFLNVHACVCALACAHCVCVTGLPEDYGEHWQKFVDETLAETNKKNAVDLVNFILSHFFH